MHNSYTQRISRTFVTFHTILCLFITGCGASAFTNFTWTRLSNTGPPSRSLAALATTSNGAYLFGGLDSAGNALDDFWSYSGSWQQIISTSTPPTARQESAAVWSGSNLYLFGGITAGVYSGELWSWDSTNDWVLLSDGLTTGPGARASSTAIVSSDGALWVFGGANDQGYWADLWKYTPSGWEFVSGSDTVNYQAGVTIPWARFAALSAYEVATNSIFIFGGSFAADGTSLYDDLWKYDITGASWTNLAGSVQSQSTSPYPVITGAPTPRERSIGGFNSDGNLYVFGGDYGTSSTYQGLNDLWRFNIGSNTWQSLGGSQSSEPGQPIGSDAYPASRWNAIGGMTSQGILIFGGVSDSNPGPLQDLWQGSVTPPVVVETSTSTSSSTEEVESSSLTQVESSTSSEEVTTSSSTEEVETSSTTTSTSTSTSSTPTSTSTSPTSTSTSTSPTVLPTSTSTSTSTRTSTTSQTSSPTSTSSRQTSTPTSTSTFPRGTDGNLLGPGNQNGDNGATSAEDNRKRNLAIIIPVVVVGTLFIAAVVLAAVLLRKRTIRNREIAETRNMVNHLGRAAVPKPNAMNAV